MFISTVHSYNFKYEIKYLNDKEGPRMYVKSIYYNYLTEKICY